MTDLPFEDRRDAGRRLARAFRSSTSERTLVLGIPRGGVVVGAEFAAALGAELDVVVVRKIGAPSNPELGLGAVGASGEPVLDERTLAAVRPSDAYLADEIEAQRAEARRRLAAYRGSRAALDVTGRDVIVVDDGIATGGTVLAAAALLRAGGVDRLVLAVPLAPEPALPILEAAFDDVVCPYTPEPYLAVGQWYADFRQVSDDEVRGLVGR